MSIDFSEELEQPIVTTSLTPMDDGEVSLRPKLLREYTGQEKAKRNLEVYIEAAKRRNEPLDHVLLYGPPGLGKASSPMRWASPCASPPGLPSRKPVIWWRCSPI